MGGNNTITVTDDNFKSEIADSKGVAMIDFWATWCGPCQRIAPMIDQIADDYKGRVKIGKIDTDSNPKIATQFSVMSIPTLLIFKDGKVYDKIMGAVAKEQIVSRIEKALAA